MLDTNFETCEHIVLRNSFRAYKSRNLGRPLQKKNCNYFSLCEESALTSNDFLSNQKVKKKKKILKLSTSAANYSGFQIQEHYVLESIGRAGAINI